MEQFAHKTKYIMEAQTQGAVVSKITKLLALSKSDNQHEAQLALSKAQELMCKHNVTVTELDGESDDKVSTIRIDETTKGCSPYRYRLAGALSEQFRCKVVLNSTRNGGRTHNSRIVVYGQSKDAEIFIEVFEWAHKAFLSLWKQYTSKLHPDVPRTEYNQEKKSFFDGYMSGLVSFLEQQVCEKALMVIIPSAVINHVKALNCGVHSYNAANTGSAEAYMSGRLAGGQAMGLKNTIEKE